ncbi:MAG: aldehyde dehydrogenase family protein, partial [Verrucomicrobia bacterium]|nr:aldehyde dehydrogenase family protein [Verrucomicrobiota bacterium]
MPEGVFYQSGQSCISVRRILVHRAVAEVFESKFLEATRALKSSDPKDEDTFIGPMISEAEAERVMDWIQFQVPPESVRYLHRRRARSWSER